jgi:hypothetical protein
MLRVSNNSEHFADKTCDNNEENIIKHDLIIERKGEIVSFEKESLNTGFHCTSFYDYLLNFGTVPIV